MTAFFSLLSAAFIPVMSAVIILYGLLKKAPVYDYFIAGAKDGLKTALEILPFLIGIFLAVNGLTASGILNLIYEIFSPFYRFLTFPHNCCRSCSSEPFQEAAHL